MPGKKVVNPRYVVLSLRVSNVEAEKIYKLAMVMKTDVSTIIRGRIQDII